MAMVKLYNLDSKALTIVGVKGTNYVFYIALNFANLISKCLTSYFTFLSSFNTIDFKKGYTY